VAQSSSLKHHHSIISYHRHHLSLHDKTMSQTLWSFLTSCRTSVSEFLPPFLCQAILTKAYKVRESTLRDWWRDVRVGSFFSMERSLSLAPRCSENLSSVGDMFCGNLHMFNQNRHHWTPRKWLGSSAVSPSEYSLPAIWRLLLWPSSGGRAAMRNVSLMM